MLMVYLPTEPTSLYGFACTDDGQRIRLQGQASALELPAEAGECVGILPWQALSWHRVNLPPKVGSRWPQVLEGLLEDALLQPPNEVHLVCGPGSVLAWRRGGSVLVCACDKQWLRAVLGPLQQGRRRVTRLVPELQPVNSDAPAQLHLLDHFGKAQALWCTSESVWPLASWTPMLKPDLTATEVFAEPSVAAHANAWSEQTPVLLNRAARWLRASQSEWDLAQHEWAQHWRTRGLRWISQHLRELWLARRWRSSRRALWALLLVQLAGLNVWAWHERAQMAAKQAMIYRMLTSMAPDIHVVVDPVGQMQRALSLRQQSLATPLADDLAVMLEVVAKEWPQDISIERFDYRQGELTLHVKPNQTPPSPAGLPGVAAGYRWQVEGQQAVMRWQGNT